CKLILLHLENKVISFRGVDAAREDGAGQRGPRRQRAPPRVPEAAPGPREQLRVRPLTVSGWLGCCPSSVYLRCFVHSSPRKTQQKDSLDPNVVKERNTEDLCLTKAASCRCPRSRTSPACGGSHNKHNELTGDGVGPLILQMKEV
uniref:CDGSH iron-sulfur domain-containing protein 2 n=1 Tax=Equus asinus TaxID=9793 RepID=A0A9L0JHW9_EQUAS